MEKKTDGGHEIPEEDLREMEQDGGQEVTEETKTQTGYCKILRTVRDYLRTENMEPGRGKRSGNV